MMMMAKNDQLLELQKDLNGCQKTLLNMRGDDTLAGFDVEALTRAIETTAMARKGLVCPQKLVTANERDVLKQVDACMGEKIKAYKAEIASRVPVKKGGKKA